MNSATRRELKSQRLPAKSHWPGWFGRLLIAALFSNWFLNLLMTL